MEIILEFIGDFFVGIIWEAIKRILRGVFAGMWWMSLYSLKLITFNKAPIEEIKIKYKDSSKPYFMILGFWIALYFIINGVN